MHLAAGDVIVVKCWAHEDCFCSRQRTEVRISCRMIGFKQIYVPIVWFYCDWPTNSIGHIWASNGCIVSYLHVYFRTCSCASFSAMHDRGTRPIRPIWELAILNEMLTHFNHFGSNFINCRYYSCWWEVSVICLISRYSLTVSKLPQFQESIILARVSSILLRVPMETDKRGVDNSRYLHL